ncbi:MAG: phosphonate ABC transporter, permease protein PhnE [Proteobacteria bacterium]|nr:phosphonate ABC transporter, permease protein PhnE [Pseudomonadota bacterium]
MSSEAAGEARPSSSTVRAPTLSLRDRSLNWLLGGGLALLLALSFGSVEMNKLPLLFSNSARSAELLSGFTRPNFAEWRLYVAETWETVQMALWGTVLAVLAALPLSLLASRNLAPWWVVRPVRLLMDVLRSVNELVVGLLFVAAVGLGPFAGVMALALHTTGVLAKLFSEAVEAVDPGPLEGVRATGASRVEEIVWGVLPQVAPLWTSFALYRFEANARSATVLGLIGAGGIGALLVDTMNAFAFDQTSAIVLVIIAAVSAIDFLSQLIRRRLL